MLLSIDCTAQKMELSLGNGIAFGPPQNPLYPNAALKLAYNINNKLQVGINANPGMIATYDVFINWYQAKGKGDKGGRLYVGANAGYVNARSDNGAHTSAQFIAAPKVGLHTGYTTPAFYKVAFYLQGGVNAGYGNMKEVKWSRHSYPGSSRYAQKAILYGTLELGIRFRFAYRSHK